MWITILAGLEAEFLGRGAGLGSVADIDWARRAVEGANGFRGNSGNLRFPDRSPAFL